jgi:hypothetical protein
VALNGNGTIAVIGAASQHSNTGAAYIFVNTGSSWLQLQKLTASDGTTNNEFGQSVAISSDGSTILVGAPYNGGRGSAYVYAALPYIGYGLQAKLTAPDGAYGDLFGYTLALSGNGNTALVSAQYHNNQSGAAYVFLRNSGAWSQPSELASGVSGGTFGASVALSNDGITALIGAPYAAGSRGAAYIFTRSGSTWSLPATLSATDGVPGDWFGYAVALSTNGTSGTAALISAFGKSSQTGAVYVFVPFFSWYQAAELPAPAGATGFGFSLALSSDGSTAVIGAVGNGFINQGAAYVYQGSWSSWAEEQELTTSNLSNGDELGWSVAVNANGSTPLIGAPGKYYGFGAAYVF